MGIKIKYRDPSLNDFDVKDLIVNVSEGSLWFKTHRNLYRILGNIEQTTHDTHLGTIDRNPDQPSYWKDTTGDADIHIGSQLGSPGTSGSKARLAIQPFSHTGGPFNLYTRDTQQAAHLDINYGTDTESKHQTTFSHYQAVGIGAKQPATGSYLHIRGDGGILDDNMRPSFGNGERIYSGSYLVIEGNSSTHHNIIQMIGSSSGQTSIWFGDEHDRNSGRLRYEHYTDQMELWAGNTPTLHISASAGKGMIGINHSLSTHPVPNNQALTTAGYISASGGFYTRGIPFINNVDASTLGWKTVAICEGGRAVGKFIVEDRNSGNHCAAIFYASHMYGSNTSHNSGGSDGGSFTTKEHHGDSIQVLSWSRYGTAVIDAIRIKSCGVYDGAAIQIYVGDSDNHLKITQIESHQSPGWAEITHWIDDSINPGMTFGSSTHSTVDWNSFVETARINLDNGQWSAEAGKTGPWIETGMAGFSDGAMFGETRIGNVQSASLILEGNVSMSEDRGIGHNFGVDSEYMIYPKKTGCQSLGGIGSALPYNNGMALFSDEQIVLVESDSDSAVGVFDVNNADMVWDGDIEYSGTITDTSDRRLKENIYVLTGSLEKVLNLEGVSFNWKNKKNKGEGTHYGFIAQEVEKVMPNIVSTTRIPQSNDDPTPMLGVSYIEVIPHLIEAIKDQQKQIDELKARLNE